MHMSDAIAFDERQTTYFGGGGRGGGGGDTILVIVCFVRISVTNISHFLDQKC